MREEWPPWDSIRDEGAALRARLDTLQARIRLGFPLWLRLVLDRRVVAITLGRRIYLASDAAGWSASALEAVLRHELVHVEQVHRLGLVPFLVSYVAEYLRHRRSGLDHWAAYEAIRFEKEAREGESTLTVTGRGGSDDI